MQILPALEEELAVKAQESILQKENLPYDENAYTPELRVRMHEEQVQREKHNDEESKKNSMFAHLEDFQPKKREGPPPTHRKDGYVY